MVTIQLISLLSLLVCCSVVPSTHGCGDRIETLEYVTTQLARQLMLQQMYVQEKSRSEGDSGIKQVMIIVTNKTFTPSHFLRVNGRNGDVM